MADKPTPLYLSDLVTGLFAALALREVPVLSLRDTRLDRAFAKLIDDINEQAKKLGLTVRFRLRTHPVHGDSPQVQHALWEAAQRDLVSLDNPEYQDVRVKITKTEAPSYLRQLPGSPQMYETLADKLMGYYRD